VTLTLPSRLGSALSAAGPERIGSVSSIVGLAVRVTGLATRIGDVVTLGDAPRRRAEIVAVSRDSATAMALERLDGVTAGSPARVDSGPAGIPVGTELLGRVIDAMGRPVDERGPVSCRTHVPVDNEAPAAMSRTRIDTALSLGVRTLDTLTAAGRGQRLGLFAGSGVGKSSLLSMIARGSQADVAVIALVGERGREVREFLEEDLGAAGLARSVVVVSTADEPPLMRVRAAFAATRIAEAFRDEGKNVMLMMDSLTRVAMAQREIGLSAGEPPATRGYPPSVFSLLARLLERAGTGPTGSVTGIYTVLVDGDDHNEPIADAVRGILDGHIVLDRKLAIGGHFPAIDPLGSVSRVASKVTTKEQQSLSLALRRVLAAKRGAQDLLDVGAYARGSNPLVDAAVDFEVDILAFLRQSIDERCDATEAWQRLERLVLTLGGAR
jgi:flagellum-specific ATP synthase